MKFEIEMSDETLKLIKSHIDEIELLDTKNAKEEELIHKLFWLPESDPNFEIGEDIKVTKIEETQGVKRELDIICKALTDDEGYYISWEANIAMAFKDEYDRYCKENLAGAPDEEDLHRIANNAAKNFLKLLISYK